MPMPYTLTKGSLLTLLENALNPMSPEETGLRDNALTMLRNGAAITDVPWVTSPEVGALPLPQDPLAVRLNRDWFGKTPAGAGWNDQQPFSGANPKPTGYWIGWHGNSEAVLREGIIRTIEVSLGITRDQQPAGATRHWPVDVSWKCPNPWFEVWVTWRRHKATPEDGQVSMIIATPPDKSNRLTELPAEPPPTAGRPPAPTPLQPPVTANDGQGMWVITHRRHVKHTVEEVKDVDQGTFLDALLDTTGALFGLPAKKWAVPMPSTFWAEEGEVVVVAPPNYAGGADPARSNAP